MIKHSIKLMIFIGLIVISFGILQVKSYSDDELMRGVIVYQANCLQCHGEKGDGNGPEVPNISPVKPTNFTSSIASVSTPLIEKAIVEGVQSIPTHSWGGILSKEDVEAVIVYIRTFQK